MKISLANPTTTSSKTWADKMITPKPSRLFHYIFQNIQGLPVKPRAHKHQQIGDASTETEANIFRMAEINLNLKVMGAASQFKEQFLHLPRNNSVHSCNRHGHDSSTANILCRGTAQITMGPSSHRVLAS